MDNVTYFKFQYLNRFSDITLSNTILMIIGAFIGVLGNATIIFFYFFRIKERGERYFIPLLGIVDLLGCLTSSPYYIMDNEYMYNYLSTAVCRILMFLQICIPGISGHTLLVISIQRYLLVCKPFRPKITDFWKRLLFGAVCLMSFAYSAPLLTTAGVFTDEVTFRNHNFTKKVCKFFGKTSLSIAIYLTILFLIMVANLIITASMYIPVLKQVGISFRSRAMKYQIHKDSNVSFPTEKNQATWTSNTTIDDIEKPSISKDPKEKEIKAKVQNSPKMARFEISDKSNKQSESADFRNDVAEHIASNFSHNVQDHTKRARDYKHQETKVASAQRRVSIMFFLLIVVYVLSYVPALIGLILLYTLEDFTSDTLSSTEMGVRIYLIRLVFLNHIINPFIYGCFDTEFKKQLCRCCLKK